MRRPRRLTATLWLAPALVVVGLLWPIARPVTGSGDTFQFWYAGHLAVTGTSPYEQAAWHAAGERFGAIAANVASNCAEPQAPVCVWAYPPLTAWYFAPFGALPPAVGLPALDLFVLLSLVAGVLATAIVFGPREPAARAILLAAAAAQHSFVVDIRAGHPIGLLLLGTATLASGLRSAGTWPLLVGALAFAAKPHLAGALAPAILAVLARQARFRTIGAVAGTLVGLVGLALVRTPEAIAAITGAGAKATIAWTTSASLAAWLGAPIAAHLAIVGLAGAAAIAAIRWSAPERRTLAVVATSAAASLVITPYAQPYDFLLAFPAFALAASAAADVAPPGRGVLLGGTTVSLLAIGWAAVALAPPLYASLPLAALLLLAGASRARLRSAA